MTGHTWIPQSVLYKVWLQMPQLVCSGEDENQAYRHMVEWVERRTDDTLDSTFSSGEMKFTHLIMGPEL